MPPGSTRAPTSRGPGAALPQELVQQAARLLGDDDRWVGTAAGGLQGQLGTPTRLPLAGGDGRRQRRRPAQWLSLAPTTSVCAVQPSRQGLEAPAAGPSTRRLAVMHVCAGWQAAVQAAPELVPARAVLTAPVLKVTEWTHYHETDPASPR
jgi:hypothetical protein